MAIHHMAVIDTVRNDKKNARNTVSDQYRSSYGAAFRQAVIETQECRRAVAICETLGVRARKHLFVRGQHVISAQVHQIALEQIRRFARIKPPRMRYALPRNEMIHKPEYFSANYSAINLERYDVRQHTGETGDNALS